MADTTDRVPHTGPEEPVRPPLVPGTEEVLENLEESPEFKELERSKSRFIIPATIFFLVYYFALPVLVGFFPDVMDKRLFTGFSIAYLFALSQFFMAWILAFLYLLWFAPKMDLMVRNIVKMAQAHNIRVVGKGGR